MLAGWARKRWGARPLPSAVTEREQTGAMPHKDPEAARAYARKWHAANRAKVNPKIAARNKRYRKEAREAVQELKSTTPCADCGQTYPYYVMQFDHVADDKVGNVSDILRNGVHRAAREEMAKCDLVCANCHAERTFRRRYGSVAQ